jgi:hypothetical protein
MSFPNLIRENIVAEFIQALPRSGQPSGVCHPNVGWPSRAIKRAVCGLVSAGAPSARRALTTSSNGVLTLARNAACEKNSRLVTIVRTTSAMSPSVRENVAAARLTRAAADRRSPAGAPA